MSESFTRGSGILLPISSLPSAQGIGDFGPGAFRFVDFCVDAEQKYWQVLPLNPTEEIFGNSPYSSNSAFAVDPVYISFEQLVQDGQLKKSDVKSEKALSGDRVEYESVRAYKARVFDLLFGRWKDSPWDQKGYENFARQNADWLDDYALFLCLKQEHPGSWNEWPGALRHRESSALKKARQKYAQDMDKIKFLQFIAQKQFEKVRDYCRQKDLCLIGDLPIYVNFDSSDVWSHPEFYKLDENDNPVYVAGVPPDYFSETGQRWGNPVYDWDRIQADGFQWWLQRLKRNFAFYDFLRIDHFRGLIGYWQVPASEETAINGEWIPGPSDAFFQCLQESFPNLPIIAEDLGIITDDVREAMRRFDIPGMKVLLFAFSGDQKTHPYIPENYIPECVVYTGTHDNNTTRGWYQQDATDEEKNNLAAYLKKKPKLNTLHWDLISVALQSVAQIALLPMQDILGLDASARMNKPGTVSGNWKWRLTEAALNSAPGQKLREMTRAARR